jgi:hypothetical protein
VQVGSKLRPGLKAVVRTLLPLPPTVVFILGWKKLGLRVFGCQLYIFCWVMFNLDKLMLIFCGWCNFLSNWRLMAWSV